MPKYSCPGDVQNRMKMVFLGCVCVCVLGGEGGHRWGMIGGDQEGRMEPKEAGETV